MSEKEVNKVKIKVDFNEASSRENIKSGESLNTIFGKIRKIITDLHSSAFTGNAAKVNGHTVNSDVPASAKFTDTTYNVATTTSNGLMSSSDKKKLDNMTTDNALSSSSTNPLQNNTITAELGKKVNTSVLPNNTGDIKTKFRIANKGYTNGDLWYFPLCKLPSDGGYNYASVIISGRIGGYQGNNMSAISAMIWSRSGTDIALFNFGGALLRDNIVWEYADIVAYENSDSTATVYLKCQGYFIFDLDLKIYQYECELLYDGTYITSTPTGTLKASASTSTNKGELINGKFYVAGKEVALSDDIPIYNNATQSAAGLMSAADKSKLESIEDGAEKNVISEIQVNGATIEPKNGVVDITVSGSGSGSSDDKLPLTGGIVTGNVQQSGPTTDYTTYKFRNIAFGASTTPPADTTFGGNGSIYFYYK